MPLTGDFGTLDELIATLSGSRESIVEGACEVAARFIDGQITQGFAAETDPYGKPWAPWAKGYRGGLGILRRSGDMLASKRVWSTGDGVQAQMDFPGDVHQAGYPPRNLPRRAIVPEPDDLPDAWEQLLLPRISEFMFGALKPEKT